MERTQKPGTFIVIEGPDGSGKSEQAKRLVARLAASGVPHCAVDFPRYGEPSSYFVQEYLNGKYGTASEVGPKQASLFYALDRFHAAPEIRAELAAGKVVIANRYVASNMGHQGGKMATREERRDFFTWLYELEYGTLNIPRPTQNIILHVPVEMGQQLVDKKGVRAYVGGVKRDIHEADLAHLKNAEAAYFQMAELFPQEFSVVECVEQGKLLSIDDIHERVWNTVQRFA